MMKVVVKSKSNEYKGFFTLEKSTLQFQRIDGSMSKEVVRENFYRGDSVAALVYDSKNEKVVLVRQFRYPVYSVDPERAWILELVAGSCEKDEAPKETLIREIEEEILIKASTTQLQELGEFFASPGGTSERIYLYAVDVDLSTFKEKSGGIDAEDENIEILHYSFKQVFTLLDQKKINDAKTIIALQWLKSNYRND